MATLVALLSSGKGSWGEVNSLVKCYQWDQIYLVCNDFSYQNFSMNDQRVVKLNFDENKLDESVKKLSSFFYKQVKEMEVDVNISSGRGMEHMALLSAILKSGLGVRFVYCENNKLEEFTILEGGPEEEGSQDLL